MQNTHAWLYVFFFIHISMKKKMVYARFWHVSMHLAPWRWHRIARRNTTKHSLIACWLYVSAFLMCCDKSARILCARAPRLCGEDWRRYTGCCGGIDPLRCHLQCRAAVFPMHQPEQWVEPMPAWLVWLGGKWKPLSRFFSLPHPNAKQEEGDLNC